MHMISHTFILFPPFTKKSAPIQYGQTNHGKPYSVLCFPFQPNDLETEIKPVQSYDEIQVAANAPLTQV